MAGDDIFVPGQAVLLSFFFQAEDGIRDLTVTGVQTCALPIFGASTAIFSVVNAVLLRELPYKDPERLAIVWDDLRNRNVTNFPFAAGDFKDRSEEHTSELQSQSNLVCRLLLEKKKIKKIPHLT